MTWKNRLLIPKLLWNILCEYAWYKQKTYEKSGGETMVDSDGVLL